MSLVLDPAAALAVRGALVLLFAGAAVHKARDLRAFQAAMTGFGVLPAATLRSAALLAVATEVAVVAALLMRPGAGAAGAMSLLATYAAAMALALARGRRGVDCGCGGPAGDVPLQGGLVARNVVLVLVAAALLLPAADRPLVWVDAVTVAGAIAAMAVVLAAANALLATGPRIEALRRLPEAA